MRLQVAIDRVYLERADEIIRLTGGYADIIEVGTSLIKDFGLAGSVGMLKGKYPEQCILADIKTCDEGEYEFREAYKAGCDIPTVMGFSSMSTLKACQRVADEYQKEYMIDLLEVPEDKLEELKKEFPEAIFCVHLPSDDQGKGLEDLVIHMCGQLEGIEKQADLCVRRGAFRTFCQRFRYASDASGIYGVCGRRNNYTGSRRDRLIYRSIRFRKKH